MTQQSEVRESQGPPQKKSKWGAVWDKILSEYDTVPDVEDGGWGEYTCKSEKDAKLLQSALHQRTMREQADWRIQTQIDGKVIFFRRVFKTDEVEEED